MKKIIREISKKIGNAENHLRKQEKQKQQEMKTIRREMKKKAKRNRK